MRSAFCAVAALLLALFSTVGPISAATAGASIVGQASQQTATITGHVSGSAVTGGLAGAEVILDGPSHASTTTDASGNYTFNVAPGIYTVTINKGGYQTGSTQVTAAPGLSQTVNVELTESSLSNLQVIGRTSGTTGTNAAKFNISSAPAVSLSQALIQQRNVPDLPKILSTIPGIVASTNSSTNNSFSGCTVSAKRRSLKSTAIRFRAASPARFSVSSLRPACSAASTSSKAPA